MNQTCSRCQSNFVLDEDDLSFYEKMQVPPPKVCPTCRFKLRALWRNEMSLYSRTCDKTGKPIIAIYNPKSPYGVVSHEYYESDEFDARDYASDYDTSRPFFDQFKELLLRVPKAPTFLSTGDGPNINSNYANYSGGLKNSYLVFNTGPAEETLYSRGLRNVKECADCYFGIAIELVYESVNVTESSKVLYGTDVSNSLDSMFISNSSACTNCFACTSLRNVSHHIYNKPVSKAEYESHIKNIKGSFQKTEEARKEFENFEKDFPKRATHNIKSIDSTGDYLFECKNVRDSFEVTKSEDCRYIFSSKEIKDSYGTIGYGFRSERLLECTSTGYSTNCIGCAVLTNCRDVMYSYFMRNSHNCIGCDSLRNAEYCILNKQYSKEDYEKLREHILEELKSKDLYGLMMPPELAPFAYNETVAQDNFPMTKEEVLAAGFRWEDDVQMTKGKETLVPEQIPDHIRDVSDEITKEVLRCISCERNYKITEQELLFYRKMVLPIPRKCFYCRHRDRIVRRGPYQFWQRNCDHCGKEITTNYAPDRPETIYCESCYQSEVV